MENQSQLKYQSLIDQYELTNECPQKSCTPSLGIGFRWIFVPIENPDNFLPSILYNERHSIPPRRNSPTDKVKCSYCAISLFNSETSARERFYNIPKHNREMLGYTHIAGGTIDGAGLMTTMNKFGHFDLFEYENIDISSTFSIIAELN